MKIEKYIQKIYQYTKNKEVSRTKWDQHYISEFEHALTRKENQNWRDHSVLTNLKSTPFCLNSSKSSQSPISCRQSMRTKCFISCTISRTSGLFLCGKLHTSSRTYYLTRAIRKAVINNWLVNPTGHQRGFVPVDLMQEHMNLYIKVSIPTLRHKTQSQYCTIRLFTKRMVATRRGSG